jgi:transposase-like protein
VTTNADLGKIAMSSQLWRFPVDPHTQFCPNSACPARGHVGRGNITIHSQREQRYRCTVCGRTFSARRGTPFYRKQYPEALITQVVTLVAHGCPEAAVVAAFALHPRTVREWITAAGQHCETVQQHLVEQPRDLGQVQADELRVQTQAGVVWMAMAMQVATRLWLGGVLSPTRDQALIRQIADLIARCALVAPLLVMVDGLVSYVAAVRRACRTRQARPGQRPARVPWPELVMGQVIKHTVQRRLVAVTRRVVVGRAVLATDLVATTQGHGGLNTSYIERLNATFRSRLARLGRRTRHGARQQQRLHAAMYLVGTVYNFCSYHASLVLSQEWPQPRTPAMAAGLAQYRWSVDELLHYQVPPARWRPPKQRGRRSKELQQLIECWAA